MHVNPTYQVGDATVTKITELRLDDVPPAALYPDWQDEVLQANFAWLSPANLNPANNNFLISIHSWLVRTPRHVILIDTAAGNHKARPRNPFFDQLNTPYLARLAAAGVQPEDVDYVLHTHLHVDHCGWNTRLVNGERVPTFSNARYVYSQPEEDYYSSPASHNEVNVPSIGVFEDSVAPIIAAGLADRIDAKGGVFLDDFTFIPTKGHSIGHMSIEFTSQGERALFCGDVMHHPIQTLHPEWNSVFCEWQDDARRSRRHVLELAADHNLLVFTSHFAETSAGYVSREGDGFQWRYA